MANPERVLENKVILVIGAGKGIGSLLSRELAAMGGTLAINDLTPINLDQVETDILSAGGNVKSYIVDVSKKIPIQSLVNSVQDDFGRIDILIHCARVQPTAALLDMDDWEWQRSLDVNLTGAFLAMQSVGRIMREQGEGKMILAGHTVAGQRGKPAYSISMAALKELASHAGSEFEEYGIQVHWIDGSLDKAFIKEQILTICSGTIKEDSR